MAWSTPRTWVTSEVVTAAQLNTNIRDNENFLRAHHGCRLFKSALQNVPNGNTDVITWNSESYDTDTLHDTSTNNSRITIPTALAGYWRIECGLNLDADVTGHNRYQVRIRKNAAGSDGSGTLLRSAEFAGHSVAHSGLAAIQVNLVATDYVEAFLASLDETRDVQGLTHQSYFSAVYLGS